MLALESLCILVVLELVPIFGNDAKLLKNKQEYKVVKLVWPSPVRLELIFSTMKIVGGLELFLVFFG